LATTQLFPIYAKLSQKILRKNARSHEYGGTEIVEGLSRFLLALRCPSHAWTWPRTNNSERFRGYDAHQTCHKCMSFRMFDTHEWRSGPVYRRRGEGLR
jgi:hypothetical protein